MLKHKASLLVLFLLAVFLTYQVNVNPAAAYITINILPDGSVDPSTAPITRNGNYYSLTNNIDGSIVVQKDNIILDGAGYTLQGTGMDTGIDLSLRTNVTIQNTKIIGFDYGIYLSSSNYNTVIGTNIADSSDGIWISDSSSNNNIVGSNITTNVFEGIYILESTGNRIFGNNITSNTFDGVYLVSSSNNNISGNNIADNGDGISSYYCTGNRIFHNNFLSNFEQAYAESSTDQWNDAYPSGGNYWNNYTGVDQKCGPNQDHPGSDGMADSHYTLDADNHDNYPLMTPWTPPTGHNIAIISVVSAKTAIGQGYATNVTVYGANKGEYPETFNVTTYIDAAQIATVAVPLEAGSMTAVTFSWNTGGISIGNHNLTSHALQVPGETNIADNNFNAGQVKVTIPGDVNGDFNVALTDLVFLANAYGTRANIDPPGTGLHQWNPNADIDNNGTVGLSDLVLLALHYGQHYP